MPGYRGHLVGGVTLYACIMYVVYECMNPSPSLFAELAVCTAAGSLFPDIDIKSKGQKYFYWLFVGLALTFLFYEQFVLVSFGSVLAMTPMLVRHRGLFHQIWFVCLLPLCFWIFLCMYDMKIALQVTYHCLFFAVGAVSHIWLDRGMKRSLKDLLQGRSSVKKRGL